MSCESFRFVYFNTFEKEAVKEHHDRAGLVLHRKRTIFCSMNHIAKINI